MDPTIVGVRECFSSLVRKIGLVVRVTNPDQHKMTYLIEISIDNRAHLYHLDCSVLQGDAFDRVLEVIGSGVEHLKQTEIQVYLRMILWILKHVELERTLSSDTVISYSYNQDHILSIEDFVTLCHRIIQEAKCNQ